MAPDRDATSRASAERIQRFGAGDDQPPSGVSPGQPSVAQILDAVPHPVFWKDSEGIYLGCNEEFARTVGLPSPADVIGKTDFDMPWPHAEAEAYRADDLAVIQSGQPRRHIVEPLQQADGARLWIDTSKVPLRTPDGQVYGVLGVYDDITDRVRAEQERLEIAERLKLALDVQGAGIWELNLRENRAFVDPHLCHFMGFAEDAGPATVEEWRTLAHPEDDARVQAAIAAHVRGETPVFEAEMRVRHRDGRYVWAFTRGRVVERDERGNPVRLIGTSTDITARKQAEEAARQERHFSESAIQAMPGVFFMFDEHGRFAKWNRTLEDVSGYTAEEIAGRSVFDLLRPDCWDLVKQRVQEVFTQGSAVAEVVLVSKDGRETPFYCQSRPTVLDGQRYVLGMGIDISERKRAEADLEHTHLLLEAVIEQSPVPITVVRAPQQTIGYVNRAAREFLGRSDEPYYTGLSLPKTHRLQTWRDIRPDGSPTPVEQIPLERTLRGESFKDEEYGVIRKDGTTRWASVSGTPVRNHQGELIAGLIVYPDVTERKQAEEQLRHREAEARRRSELLLQLMMRGTLFGGELNTALAEITAAGAELLQTERVGIWFYEDQYQSLRCMDAYRRSGGTHTSGETLCSADFPTYNASHLEGQVITATDVRTDPRTCEIPAAYWDAHDIRSLVDAPVWLRGRLGAVVCFEHVGARRQWSADDERIATTLATLVSLCVESAERQRSDAALRKSEGVLRSMLDATPAGVGLLFGRIFQQVNGAMCTMTGYAREELIGQNTRVLYATAEEHERVGRELYDQMHRTGLGTLEAQLKRKDGAPIDVQLSLSPFDPQNPAAGVTATVLDITERKRAERALRDSEAMMRGIFLASPLAVSFVDADRTIRSSNGRVAQILGYSPEEVTGINSRMLYPSDEEYLRVGQELQQHVCQTGLAEVECRMRRKDGDEIDVQLNAAPLRTDDPSAGSVVTLLDITERKRAERALRESENLLRSIFRAAPAAIGIVGLDRQLKFLNERTRDVLGYAPQELIGQEARILYPSDAEYERIGRMLYPELQQVGFVQMEGCMRRKDASTIDVLINGTYLRPDDPSAGVVYTILDITERKRAEQALRQSESRLRGIFRAVPVVIGMIAADRTMDLVNEQMQPVLGYRPDEVIGRNSRMLYVSEDEYLRVGRDLYRDLWHTGSAQTEGRMRHKDGTDVHMLISAAPLRPDDPSAGSVVTLLDITARKQAEQALLREKTFSDAVLDSVPGLLYLYDHNGRLVRWNRQHEQLTGYSADELRHMHVLDWYKGNAEDTARIAAGVQQALDIGQANAEANLITKSGRAIPFYFTAVRLTIDGEVYFTGVGIDITERKRAEAELERTRLLLEAIIEQSPAPTAVASVPDCVVRYANQAALDLLGVTDEPSYVGLTLGEVAARQSWQDVRLDGTRIPHSELPMGRALRGERSRNEEYGILRKDGTLRWELVSGTPVYDRNGTLVAGLIIFPDITEQKRAERALRAAEERWQFALEGAGDGVWDWNAQTNEVFFSRQWKAMLGYAEDEISASLSEWESRVHPDDLPRTLADLQRHLSGQSTTYTNEHRMRCKDGSWKWILDRGRIVSRAPDGQPLRVVGTHTDLTERKRAEEALQQAHRRLDEIIQFLPDATLVIDAHGRVIAWNRAIEQMTGIQKEDMIGRGDHDYAIPFYGERRPLLIDLALLPDEEFEGRNYASVSRQGDILRAEAYVPQTYQGKGAALAGTASRLRDAHGNIVGAIESIRDITEHKRAEAALQESEQRYRNFVANASEGIYRIDFPEPIPVDLPTADLIARIDRGAIVGEVNEALAGMYGLRAADMIGRPATDFAPQYGERGVLVLQRENYQVVDEETLDLGKDGRPIHLSENYTGVVEDGCLVRIWGVQRDITERRRAEEQLRQREAELRRQGEVLLQLMMRGALFSGDLDTAIAEITEAGTQLIQTERVSVWWYDDDCQMIRCADAYQRSTGRHQGGETLCAAEFPTYTASHRQGQVVAADDVRTDPRTREVPAAYWDSHNVNSLVDAPVWLHGRLGGLVSFEHVGPQRAWSPDDERAAATLATLVTLCVESAERRRSEDALRENETKYRALFEAAGDAAFVLGVDGDDVRVLESNQRAQELFGATRAQLNASTVADLSAPVQPDGTSARATAAAHARHALEGETRHFEWRHRRLDGTEFDADVVVTSVPIGAERQLVGVLRDITRRKQAEAALLKRERLLDNIIEQNPYPLWISDAQGTLVRINRACCELLGVNDTDVVNRYNVLNDNIVHEQGILPQIQSVYSDGRTARIIYDYDLSRWQLGQRGPARCLTLESTVAPVKDENGTITNAVFMHHDITQRVRAENELRESERKYRALSQEFRTILEAIPGSLVLISPDLKIVWGNEYAATSLGLQPGELLGQYCYRCRHNRSVPCEVCAVQRCFASGKPETGEAETSAGLLFEVHAAPVRGEQGEIVGVIEAAYDVTDYRRADRELKASEARLRSLFRAAPIGIIFAKDRTTVSVNDALCDLLGYTQAELLDQTSRLVYFSEEEYEEVGRRLYSTAPAAGHSTFETCLRRKDGTAVDVLLSGAPLRPEEPDAGFVVTVQDITQRRQAEEELKKLAAVVRHSSELVNLASFDGRMIFLNDAGARMLGIDPQAVAQHNVLDAIPERWRPLIEHEIMPALMAGQTWEGEIQYRNLQTGHLTDVHATTFTINDPATGRPAYYVNVSRDITERKRAEMELVREKEFTEKLLESLPGIFFLYDSTCHLKRWNKAHETAMGFTADDLRDWYIPDWHETPEDAAAGLAFVKQVLETGVGGALESTLINKEGRFVPYLLSVTRLMTPDGPAMMGVGIDITERKRAEESLRRTNETLQAVITGSPLAIVTYDANQKVVTWSPAAEKIFGWGAAEVIGQQYPLAPPGHEAEAAAVIGQALHGVSISVQDRLRQRKDGSPVEVSVSTAPLRDEAGHIVGAMAILADVTEHRRADRELKASESTLRSVFRATPIGILFSVNRTMINVNDSMGELTGYSLSELVGQNTRMLYATQEEYDDVGRRLYVQAPRGRHTSLESRFRRKDGALINIMLTASLLDPEDPAAGYVVTVQDITQRRRAEEERQKLEAQLRQSQKMEAIGQLAGGVAHDFNNILTAVFGNVELAVSALRDDHLAPGDALAGLQQIERSAQRASSLTRQLLAFSRRQVTRPEVFSLNATLRDLEKMLRRLLTENITVEQLLASDLMQIRADAGQLEQVVINLVVNARDAMPNGGRLSLETHNVVLDDSYAALHPGAQAGEHIVLTVSDTGCGMDSATLERIFEPFFTTKPKGQGTGLGLSTVYGIVKQAGGHVTVYSEPGRGTTFKVYLPAVHAAPVATKTAPVPTAAPCGTETLVVCEDDTAVRELTAQMLTTAGYKVLVAPGAAEALKLAAQHNGPIQLLITDVIMPGLNGRQLSEALTAARPDIRTLFVSGYTSNVIAHHGVLDQGVDFLEKPYSRQHLLQRVREILDRSEPTAGAAPPAATKRPKPK